VCASYFRCAVGVDLTTIIPMSRPSKSNVPEAALRWSIERAGIEFGLASQTLRKSLAKSSAAPDANRLFSTRQIVDALYGALHQEKVRTQKELADRYGLENAITRAEVLNRAEVERIFATIADAIKTRIMSSGLSRHEKEDILKDIASFPIVLKEVAHAQSRLPRAGNGKRNEEDASED
jgi:hypothetical protein